MLKKMGFVVRSKGDERSENVALNRLKQLGINGPFSCYTCLNSEH